MPNANAYFYMPAAINLWCRKSNLHFVIFSLLNSLFKEGERDIPWVNYWFIKRKTKSGEKEVEGTFLLEEKKKKIVQV